MPCVTAAAAAANEAVSKRVRSACLRPTRSLGAVTLPSPHLYNSSQISSQYISDTGSFEASEKECRQRRRR